MVTCRSDARYFVTPGSAIQIDGYTFRLLFGEGLRGAGDVIAAGGLAVSEVHGNRVNEIREGHGFPQLREAAVPADMLEHLNFDPKRTWRVGAVRRASCVIKPERTSA